MRRNSRKQIPTPLYSALPPATPPASEAALVVREKTEQALDFLQYQFPTSSAGTWKLTFIEC